jgi:hypothetical protein
MTFLHYPRLGRLIRDIRRKIADQAELEAAFQRPLVRAEQMRAQQQRQRGSVERWWTGIYRTICYTFLGCRALIL